MTVSAVYRHAVPLVDKHMGVCNVQSYGAKGDGATDDTAAIKGAFAEALTSSKHVYFPAGRYRVADTVFSQTTAMSNLVIEGAGNHNTTIEAATLAANKAIIVLEDCEYLTVRDIGFVGTGKTGIGISMGRYVAAPEDYNAVNRSQFQNVYFSGFDIGLAYNSGWISDFYSLRVTNCNTGVKLVANAVNFYGLMAENNVVGVHLANIGKLNCAINFLGGTIEANTTGLKVDSAGDVNLFGVYFELNTGAHILAGTGASDSVRSFTMIGGQFGYQNPVVFDRVRSLKMEGVAYFPNHGMLKITENVQMLNVPQFIGVFGSGASDDIEFVEILGKKRQSNTPWFHSDFSRVSVPVATNAEIPLDNDKVVRLKGLWAGTISEYGTYITGNKALRHNPAVGDTYNGMAVVMDAAKLPTTDYLNFALAVFVPSGATYFRRYLSVTYLDTLGATKTAAPYDSTPVSSTVGLLANKYLTTYVGFDVKAFKAATANFSSLKEVQLIISRNADVASDGTEWFALDSFEIYTSKYVTSAANGVKDALFAPLEIEPSLVYTSVLKMRAIPALLTPDASQRGKVVKIDGMTAVAEVASLQITAATTATGNVTVTLNGVAANVSVALSDTAIQVADKIRLTSFAGWTTGGTTGTNTVTFTAVTAGAKVDSSYGAGTTGATGIMTTTTQGVTSTADAVYVCKKLADDSYNWVQIG